MQHDGEARGCGLGSSAVVRIASLFSGPAAVIVATTDASGRPAVTRAWGGSVSHEGSVVLCVTAAPGSVIRHQLESHGAIAVTAADPTNYTSVQVKGVVIRTWEPSDDDLLRVHAHVARFSDAVAALGVLDGSAWFLGQLVGVECSVAEAYDQTPGAAAGRRLT